jgi:hypothetical protein
MAWFAEVELREIEKIEILAAAASYAALKPTALIGEIRMPLTPLATRSRMPLIFSLCSLEDTVETS